MHINQLKESNYLKKEDCNPPLLVTIDHIDQKNIALEGDPPDMKWCLHFAEDVKPMICNSTNAQLIAMAVGSEETDDWAGKQIVLYNDPNVSYQGKLVGGVRVRASVVEAAPIAARPRKSQPVTAPDDDSDSIPF